MYVCIYMSSEWWLTNPSGGYSRPVWAEHCILPEVQRPHPRSDLHVYLCWTSD